MNAADIRKANGTTQCARPDTALRLARIALAEGKAPTVRIARDAIAWCAKQAEDRGDAGASAEAVRLAPYAVSRAGGDA